MDHPGISIVAEAEIARRSGEVTALHDPTEGGLASAVRELAAVSGAGVEIDADAVPILPETRAVADALGIDPLGMLASGSLLIATRPDGSAKRLCTTSKQPGSRSAVVGRLTDDPREASLISGGTRRPLPEFAVDEVARLLSQTRGSPVRSSDREFMSLLLVGSVNAQRRFPRRHGHPALGRLGHRRGRRHDPASRGEPGRPLGRLRRSAEPDGRGRARREHHGRPHAGHGRRGGVAGLSGRHLDLARVVMDELPHVLVVGAWRGAPGQRGRVPASGSADPGSPGHLGITVYRSRHRGRLSRKDARACRALEPGSGAPARRSWHGQRHRPRCGRQPRQRREHVRLGLEISRAALATPRSSAPATTSTTAGARQRAPAAARWRSAAAPLTAW